MMLPTNPVANFIVCHTRFALATIKAFFDAMSGLGHTTKFFRRCLDVCVAHVVILFGNSFIAVSITDHHQSLDGHFRRAAMPRFNPTLQQFNNKRSLLSISNINVTV